MVVYRSYSYTFWSTSLWAPGTVYVNKMSLYRNSDYLNNCTVKTVTNYCPLLWCWINKYRHLITVTSIVELYTVVWKWNYMYGDFLYYVFMTIFLPIWFCPPYVIIFLIIIKQFYYTQVPDSESINWNYNHYHVGIMI